MIVGGIVGALIEICDCLGIIATVFFNAGLLLAADAAGVSEDAHAE